ncbi:MAG: ASCH domain-containing protein [Verrucomicrobia bacterium]|nr:ASCH domain-containing protein [Verrucomicrobiota bacterium]
MEPLVSQFWRDYLNTLPAGQSRPEAPAGVFAFGDSKELADELAALVREGLKTATCSAVWTYEEDQKPIPQKGELSIVIDGTGNPVAVIETVQIFLAPFNEVTERFAWEEGEGDRSLAYWRQAHRNFFGRQRFRDRTFDEQMPLVCERFRVLHVTSGR